MPSARSQPRPDARLGRRAQTAPFAARELRLPAQPHELTRARDYVSAAAWEFGLGDADRLDLVFAANEAVTNAIRHGAADADGTIWVEIVADRDRLVVTVSDFGSFVSRSAERDPLAEGGRGFQFMTRLVDEVELTTRRGRTTVRLSQRRDTAGGVR